MGISARTGVDHRIGEAAQLQAVLLGDQAQSSEGGLRADRVPAHQDADGLTDPTVGLDGVFELASWAATTDDLGLPDSVRNSVHGTPSSEAG